MLFDDAAIGLTRQPCRITLRATYVLSIRHFRKTDVSLSSFHNKLTSHGPLTHTVHCLTRRGTTNNTMSRKLCCVAAALMCLLAALVGALTNNQILADARDKGMLTVNALMALFLLLAFKLSPVIFACTIFKSKNV